MNDVFLKTRELGEALLQSDEYKKMKEAEDKAMQNQQAAETVAKYLEKKQEVEKLLVNEQPDTVALKTLSDEMDALQESLKTIDDLVVLADARQAFSGLIDQVNEVLHFIITGKVSETDENACTGSCATCGGCHDHHHHGLN